MRELPQFLEKVDRNSKISAKVGTPIFSKEKSIVGAIILEPKRTRELLKIFEELKEEPGKIQKSRNSLSHRFNLDVGKNAGTPRSQFRIEIFW